MLYYKQHVFAPSDGVFIFALLHGVGMYGQYSGMAPACDISFYQTFSHLLDIYIQDYEIIMKSSL